MAVISVVTPIRLTSSAQPQLSTVARLLFTCPAGEHVKIQACTFSNLTGTIATATLNLVPAGTNLNSSGQMIGNQPIPANGSYVGAEMLNHYLLPGDQLWASASVNSAINLTISGVSFS